MSAIQSESLSQEGLDCRRLDLNSFFDVLDIFFDRFDQVGILLQLLPADSVRPLSLRTSQLANWLSLRSLAF